MPNGKDEIPIEFHGPIPYVRIRYPTDEDMENYQWIELTSKEEWKPYHLGNESISSTLSNNLENIKGKQGRGDLFINDIDYNVIISAIGLRQSKNSLTPERLSNMWRIPLLTAKRTIEGTTHRFIRTNEGHLSRRYRTDTHSRRRYKRLGGPYARFYTDTLFFKIRTVSQFLCAQIYSNRIGYTKIYPMVQKSQAHESLSTFIHEVGIPHEIHCDEAQELIQGEMKKKMIKYEIYNTWAESYSPWQNSAEDSIRVIKAWARYFM